MLPVGAWDAWVMNLGSLDHEGFSVEQERPVTCHERVLHHLGTSFCQTLLQFAAFLRGDLDNRAMAGCECSLGLGIGHMSEGAQVGGACKLIMPLGVTVIHQAPVSSYEGEHTCSFHIVLGLLAESIQQGPLLRGMEVLEHILADALVSALLLGLEEEVIESRMVPYDVRIDGRSMEVKEHLRVALQVGEVGIGIGPVDTVIGYGTIVGKEREVHHILASLLVIDGLGSPHTGYASKVLSLIPLGEMHGVMLPMDEVTRLHEHDATVAAPSQGRAHIGGHHEILPILSAQDVRVTHTSREGNTVRGHHRIATIEGRIVETIVAYGISDLLLLRFVTSEIHKEILVASTRHHCHHQQKEGEEGVAGNISVLHMDNKYIYNQTIRCVSVDR